MNEQQGSGALWKGAIAGLAAGLVASFAMNQFQAAVAKLSGAGGEGEPATEKVADRLAEAATGDPVPQVHKAAAGNAVHYALGGALGLAYGVAAEVRPSITAGGRTAFGSGVAALLDEGAVPAMGLGEAPWKADAATHAYTLASHVVFGGVAEAVRRLVRRAL